MMGTCSGCYATRIRRIRVLTDYLGLGLKAHEERQAGRSGDWGFPGDLALVEERIREALRALSYEFSEPVEPVDEG
jgi:hypothetical protein